MGKINVGVLSGGLSLEYDVSKTSAKHVVQHLANDKYEVFDIIIDKKGLFFYNNREITLTTLCSKIDIAILALHGFWGEDGQVQELLDKNNIPYVGSDALSSKNSFSKIITKTILKECGIKTPDYVVLDKNITNYHLEAKHLIKKFPYGCVVKVNNSGSSFGIFVCLNEKEVYGALNKVFNNFSFVDGVFVEKYILGIDYTCGVVEYDGIISVLPIIELIPKKSQKFLDFDAKYSGKVRKICPANIIDIKLVNKIQELAKKVHKALLLSDFSRTDFIYSEEGELFVLEINSIPCLASTSLFYQELKVAQIEFSYILDKLISKKLQSITRKLS